MYCQFENLVHGSCDLDLSTWKWDKELHAYVRRNISSKFDVSMSFRSRFMGPEGTNRQMKRQKEGIIQGGPKTQRSHAFILELYCLPSRRWNVFPSPCYKPVSITNSVPKETNRVCQICTCHWACKLRYPKSKFKEHFQDFLAVKRSFQILENVSVKF